MSSAQAVSPVDVRQAIRTASEVQDEHAWLRLLDVLAATAVGVPLGADPSELVFRRENGVPVFFAFTDVESAQAWDGPAAQWAQVPMPRLCRTLHGTGAAQLALNVAGPAAVTLDTGSIGYLASLAAAGQAPDRVTLQAPSGPVPDEFFSLVRRVLLGYSGIAAAYFVGLRTAEETHWGIAVRSDDPAEYAEAVQGLQNAIASNLPEWQRVDVVPVSEAEESRLRDAGLHSVLSR